MTSTSCRSQLPGPETPKPSPWGIVAVASADASAALDDGALAAAVVPAELAPPSSSLADEMRSALGELWESGAFSDCRLVPRSGEEMACHRAVLSARSAHFRLLLEPTATAVTAAPIRLTLDLERPLLLAALRFVYLDEPPDAALLSHADFLALRGVARDWKLSGLLHETAVSLARGLTTRTVCATLHECAREESRARLAGAPPHPSTLLLKAAAGAFAAARFDVLRGGSVGGADGASPAPASELSRLPSALRVWLFAQRSPLPLHLLAAEGSSWSVEGSASEVSAEVSALLQGLLAPPHSCALNHAPSRHEAGGAFCGATPLAVALSRHHWALCSLLLDMGASLNPGNAGGGGGLVCDAGAEGRTDGREGSHGGGGGGHGCDSGAGHTYELEGSHGGGSGLLHVAAAAADTEAVAFLIRRGAAVNETDARGGTPLDACVIASLAEGGGGATAEVRAGEEAGEVVAVGEERGEAAEEEEEPSSIPEGAEGVILEGGTQQPQGGRRGTSYAGEEASAFGFGRVAALLRAAGGRSRQRAEGGALVHAMAAAGAAPQLRMLLQGIYI